MKVQQPLDTFRARLKSKNLKATPQRVAVHEAMLQMGHASADMVVKRISESGNAKVTVASVYNILSGLADVGIYKRLLNMGSKMFFDVNTSNHMHIYDVSTGEYRDVIDDEATGLLTSYFRKKHFKGLRIESINVQLVCRPTTRRKKV